MTETPVSLDKLIAFVKNLSPEGGPLENLSDAVAVGSEVNEVSDSLIGHFVDRARSSGASWSEIGASMGVTKQAAQKRFVIKWGDDNPMVAGRRFSRFSRFTPRARHCVAEALAAARAAGAESVEVEHLVAGLTAEPLGLAAVVMHQAGATDEQVRAVFLPPGTVFTPSSAGTAGTAGTDTDTDTDTEIDHIPFSEDAKSALVATLHAALNLGHNYIGTEHILLGVLHLAGPAAEKLADLGVTPEFTHESLAAQFAKIQAAKQS
ncbi:MAG TPA: Clp protease N-terminal domain-containing protein [Actinocrinis sp.]|nr:Clp protease N-terminal domain-containing protein [Actinocrinis sp.]